MFRCPHTAQCPLVIAPYRAGKAFAQYRKQGGKANNVLADFFIGAHAAVLGWLISSLVRMRRCWAVRC